MMRACAAGLTVLASCPGAWAQEASGGIAANPLYLLVQALVSLAVVIGVIYLAWFALRRLSQRQAGMAEDGPMHVIQTRHLGGDRWLYLVRVGKRTLVIGGGPEGVRPVADLGEEEHE